MERQNATNVTGMIGSHNTQKKRLLKVAVRLRGVSRKAAQPRSSEKNAASRAGKIPYSRWAVGILLAKALMSVLAENRAFEEKQALVFLPKI